MNVDDLIKALQVVPNPSATEVRLNEADMVVAAGDFTGGTPEDEFNLTAHGLVDGDRVQLLYESAAGVVTGAIGDVFIIKIVDANSFQLTTDGTTVVENTADGTAIFINLTDLAVSLSGAEEAGIDEDDAGFVEIG